MNTAIKDPKPVAVEMEPVGLARHHYRKARSRILRTITPRLGVLKQYPPRQIRIPVVPVDRPTAKVPTISIVTPSYQQGQFLSRSIDSILSQGYPDLEYFVQDGGSTDGSLSVLHEFNDRLSGWASEPDMGQAQAINRAFNQTSGEIMGWLNSDDVLMPATLHRVANYFSRHPEVSVLYGNRVLINEEGLDIGRWILPDHDPEILRWIDYVPQETLFWRRSAWEAVGGGLDESLQFALDWDFLLRLQENGARFTRLPYFLGAFRIHPHQKTSTHLHSLGAQEIGNLRRRTLGYCPTEEEVSQRVKWYLYRHLVEHARVYVKDWMNL